MSVADLVATWSKDRSTKVGCVIVGTASQVLSLGYNGFPRLVDDDVEERHERPAKYFYAEHAERNSVYNAARTGVSLVGSTLYCTLFPCSDCARAIIQSGVSTVVTLKPVFDTEKWNASWACALEMLRETHVHLRWFER